MDTKQVKAGKWILEIEVFGTRYVVRLANGYALTLGAKRKQYLELIEKVEKGGYDDYIAKHCNNGI